MKPAKTGLTEREREVVALLSNGNSSQEVAQLLNISPKTVGTYKRRIADYFGIDIRKTVLIAMFALHQGLAKNPMERASTGFPHAID